jgi:hypothetical protein
MRRRLPTNHVAAALLLLGVGAGLQARSDAGVILVRGKAQLTEEYAGRWGGRAPTPEEIERLRRRNEEAARPKPVPSAKFLVRRGRENSNSRPVAEFVTRPDGTFEVALGPGTWCVVEEAKRHAMEVGASAVHTDAECMRAKRARCDAVWTLDGAPQQELKIVLTRRYGGRPDCWRGPSPPSAAPRREAPR